VETKAQDRVLQVLAKGLDLRKPDQWSGLWVRARRVRTSEEEELEQAILDFDLQELHRQSEQVSLWFPMHFPAPDSGRQKANRLQSNDGG